MIEGIAESNFPKQKIYLFFIVDGNQFQDYETLMEILTKQTSGKKLIQV